MAFGRKYLVDPATGLKITIKDTSSITGKPELHTAATATVTANWNPDIVDLANYISAGRHAKVFVFDQDGNDLPRETIYLFAHDYSPGSIDDITFTGYYPDIRLQWQIVPYNLPGEPPYLTYPEDSEGNIQPLRADQIIQAILAKIKSKGAYGNLNLRIHGEMPLVVLEHKAGARFDEYLNGMVSTKSITYYTEETIEGVYTLHVFPWFEAGVDRSAEVEFNLGSAQEIFETEVNSQNVISKYTVVGKNGDIWEGENTAVSALLGEPRADGVQRNDLYTKDMVDAWGAATLEQLSSFAPAYTFNGVDTMLIPGCYVLGVDYNVGDTVSVCVDGVTRLQLRVESATVAVVDSGTRQIVTGLRIGRSPREIRPKLGVVDPYNTGSTDPIPTDTTGNNGPLPTPSNPGGEIPGDGGGDNGGGDTGRGNTVTTGNPGSVVAIQSVEDDGTVNLGQTTLGSMDGGVFSNGTFHARKGIDFTNFQGDQITGSISGNYAPDAEGLYISGSPFTVGKGVPKSQRPQYTHAPNEIPFEEPYVNGGNDKVFFWGSVNQLGSGGTDPHLGGTHVFEDLYLYMDVDSWVSLRQVAKLMNWPRIRFTGNGDPGDGGGTPNPDYSMTPTSVRKGISHTFTVTFISTTLNPPADGDTGYRVEISNSDVTQYLLNTPSWQDNQIIIELSSEAFESQEERTGHILQIGAGNSVETTLGTFEITGEVDESVRDNPDQYPDNGTVQPRVYEKDRPTLYRLSAPGHEGETVNLLAQGVYYPDIEGTVDQDGYVYLVATFSDFTQLLGLRTPTGDVGGTENWGVSPKS